jgi:hypothetical protein
VGLNPPKDLKTPTTCWGFLLFNFVYWNYFCILVNMKKYTFVFVLLAVAALSACGNGSTTTEKTDSTSVQTTVQTDSTESVNIDSVEVTNTEVK